MNNTEKPRRIRFGISKKLLLSVILMTILICVIAMCIMVSRAMDYDPAWDEDQNLIRREYDDEE